MLNPSAASNHNLGLSSPALTRSVCGLFLRSLPVKMPLRLGAGETAILKGWGCLPEILLRPPKRFQDPILWSSNALQKLPLWTFWGWTRYKGKKVTSAVFKLGFDP